MTRLQTLQTRYDQYIACEAAMADACTLIAEGVTYNIPVIVQQEQTEKNDKKLDGVYQDIIDIFFKDTDVARPPIRGQEVVFDNTSYYVAKSVVNDGVVHLTLGVPEV